MKSKQLLDDLQFHQSVPFAQPLFVRKDGRVLRWMLQPGQQITEHSVPHSPFYVGNPTRHRSRFRIGWDWLVSQFIQGHDWPLISTLYS
jgi:hypothetical protein